MPFNFLNQALLLIYQIIDNFSFPGMELDILSMAASEVDELVDTQNMLWSLGEPFQLPQLFSGNPMGKCSMESTLKISGSLLQTQNNRKSFKIDDESMFLFIEYYR